MHNTGLHFLELLYTYRSAENLRFFFKKEKKKTLNFLLRHPGNLTGLPLKR
jgi:hypothetical protein